MRIDFHGEYRKLQSLFSAKDTPRPATPHFAEELEKHRAVNRPEVAEKTQQNALPRSPMITLPEPNAQLRLPEFPASTATLSGMILEPANTVKEQAQSVKTPTVETPKPHFAQQGTPKASLTVDRSQLNQLVENKGKEFGIDPALGLAVAAAESGFNITAVSQDGFASKGLFQLLDSTGSELHERAGIEEQYDPFNPEQNAHLGVKYLRRLHDTFSQSTRFTNDLQSVPAANSSSLEKLAVAAFNAGEGRVASAQARARQAGLNPSEYEGVEPYLPKSTQSYVSKVMQLKGDFSGETS